MKEQIYEILAGIRPEYDFKSSTNFIEDGMLDSFDIVTLVTDLEDAFGISIDGEQVVPENFSTIDGIVNLVENSEKI